jgi:hypothetical protein
MLGKKTAVVIIGRKSNNNMIGGKGGIPKNTKKDLQQMLPNIYNKSKLEK